MKQKRYYQHQMRNRNDKTLKVLWFFVLVYHPIHDHFVYSIKLTLKRCHAKDELRVFVYMNMVMLMILYDINLYSYDTSYIQDLMQNCVTYLLAIKFLICRAKSILSLPLSCNIHC